MECRVPKGLLLVFTNCTDPTKEQDFNKWYDQECIARASSGGTFNVASRWADIRKKSFGHEYEGGYVYEGGYKYLAIYETDKPPSFIQARLKQGSLKPPEQSGRPHPALGDLKMLFFSRLTASFRPDESAAGGVSQGVMVVFSDCSSNVPAEVTKFNEWYDAHLRVMISDFGYYTASRWVNSQIGPGDRKYMAMYEVNSDPTQMFAEMSTTLDQVEANREKGIKSTTWPTPETLARVVHWLYRRIPTPARVA